MTLIINPAVGWLAYFLSGPRLPSQLQRYCQADSNFYVWMNKRHAHACERLAQGRCVTAKLQSIELAIATSWIATLPYCTPRLVYHTDPSVRVRCLAGPAVARQLDVGDAGWPAVGAVWTLAARHRDRMRRAHQTTRPRRTTLLHGHLVAPPAQLDLVAVLRGTSCSDSLSLRLISVVVAVVGFWNCRKFASKRTRGS